MIDPRARPLRRSDLDADPLAQFQRWYDEAGSDAVALATATAEAEPSARMVLLKRADQAGFVFDSSDEGRKARDLEANPRAARLFDWHELGRQVRVEGQVGPDAPSEWRACLRTRQRGGPT